MKAFNVKACVAILFVFAFLILESFVLSKFIPSYSYYLKPILWWVMCIPFWIFIRRNKTIINKKEKISLLFFFATMALIIYYFLGFAVGYNRSAYNRSFFGIVKNLASFASILIPYEIIRHSTLSASNNKINTAIVWFVMGCVYLGISRFVLECETGLKFTYILGTLLPCFITSAFLCFASKNIGLSALLIWQLIPSVVGYVTPILPSLDWFLKLMFVVMSTIIPFVYFYYMYANKQLVKDRKVGRAKHPAYSITTMLVVVIIVGFFAGLLPIEPTVILSDSMKSKFARGDLVLVNKLADYDVSNIIQFEQDDRVIVHRIIEKKTDEKGKTYYVTKGDNNNVEDDWKVYDEKIHGVVIFVIPKIGFFTIWVREFIGV